MISVLDKWNDVQQARDCNNKKEEANLEGY